jgi:hypothetical protein
MIQRTQTQVSCIEAHPMPCVKQRRALALRLKSAAFGTQTNLSVHLSHCYNYVMYTEDARPQKRITAYACHNTYNCAMRRGS